MPKRRIFTLQITERCNLSCKYCYVLTRRNPEPDDCSWERCQEFIDFVLRESDNNVRVAFFGGEPLLRLDLIRHTVNYGKHKAPKTGKNIKFHINTNGVLLDEVVGDFITEENIGLEVSIDGPGEIHDRHRPYPDGSGSFETVYNNLVKFNKRHPGYKVQIFSVIAGGKSLPWLQSLLKELNSSDFTYNPVHLSLEQEKDLGIRYTEITQQALKMRVQRYKEQFLRGNTNFDEGLNRQIAFFLNGKAVRSCEIGINTTIATQSGKIYPCPLFIGHEDQVIGDLSRGFYPEKVQPFLDRTVESIKSCKQCRIRYFCGGGCAFSAYQRTGSISSSWKDDCSVTQQYARDLEESIFILASKKPEDFLKSTKILPKTSAIEVSKKLPSTAANSFVIRLSGECNLSCDYCYEKNNVSRNGHLDIKTARSIVKYIMSQPGQKPLISLFGGEPLLNWETARFLIETVAAESLKNHKNPFFHLTTNGTLITREIAKTMAGYNVTVQISLDGSKPKHDLHRKYPDGAGSYEAILKGIEILREVQPEVKIDAQVVLTPGNTNTVRIVQELKAKGFRRINFLKSAWEEGSSLKWSDKDIKNLMKSREEFFPYFLESATRGRSSIDMSFASLVASEPKGSGGLCECGAGQIYIDTKGDIYPCPQIYSPGKFLRGNCLSADFRKSMDRPLTAKEIDDDCLRCWAYSRCRGGCLVHCGKCPLISSNRPGQNQKLWCDLMRAEFARAIIAHKILGQYYPERLKALKAMWTG